MEGIKARGLRSRIIARSDVEGANGQLLGASEALLPTVNGPGGSAMVARSETLPPTQEYVSVYARGSASSPALAAAASKGAPQLAARPVEGQEAQRSSAAIAAAAHVRMRRPKGRLAEEVTTHEEPGVGPRSVLSASFVMRIRYIGFLFVILKKKSEKMYDSLYVKKFTGICKFFFWLLD